MFRSSSILFSTRSPHLRYRDNILAIPFYDGCPTTMGSIYWCLSSPDHNNTDTYLFLRKQLVQRGQKSFIYLYCESSSPLGNYGGIEESFSVQTGFHYVLFLECTNGISGKLIKKFECKQAHGDKSCFITILLLVSLDQLLFIRREELRNLQTNGRIIFVSVPFNEDIKFCWWWIWMEVECSYYRDEEIEPEYSKVQSSKLFLVLFSSCT